VQGGKEVGAGFEVSRGDSAEVFEAIEEPLDAVALPVEVSVHAPDDAHIRLAGDVGGGPRGLDGGDHRPTVIPPVANHVSGELEGADKVGRGGLVRRLARREQEPDRQAAAVNDRVDLRRQTSSRETDGVIRTPLFPPAACWWARTMELSIKCRECGDFSANASKIRSQTPAFAHLL
jgi:hypothetical protein